MPGPGGGQRPVFVPITPCRLVDTRPAPETVGPRAIPLGPNETHTVQVRGVNGNCTIPNDAVGVVMNVAAISPTAGSFLTVFPPDATKPLAANLNWVAGQPPVSNAVTADLSADGKVAFYNLTGNVDIAADVVGYFVDHVHDDRYYTEAEIDTKLATKVDKTTGTPTTVVIGSASFAPASISPINFSIDPSNSGLRDVGGALCFNAALNLPNGATVTAVRLDGFDLVGPDLSMTLLADPSGSTNATLMAAMTSNGANGVFTASDVTISSPVVNTATNAYSLRVCSNVGLFFYSARIDYLAP